MKLLLLDFDRKAKSDLIIAVLPTISAIFLFLTIPFVGVVGFIKTFVVGSLLGISILNFMLADVKWRAKKHKTGA